MADENIRDETQETQSVSSSSPEEIYSYPPEGEILSDNDQASDILMVEDKENGTLEAVAGIDEEGNVRTVPADGQHAAEFLQLGINSDLFDVVMTALRNFYNQTQNPTRFRFFKVPYEAFRTSKNIFTALINGLRTDQTKEFENKYWVEPKDLDFNDPKLQKILHKYLKTKKMENQEQQNQQVPQPEQAVPQQQNSNIQGNPLPNQQGQGYPQGMNPYPPNGYPQQQPFPNQQVNYAYPPNGYPQQPGGYPGQSMYPNQQGQGYPGQPVTPNQQVSSSQGQNGNNPSYQGYNKGNTNQSEARYKFHPNTVDEQALDKAGIPVAQMKKNGDWERMLKGWDSVYVYTVELKSWPLAAKLEGRARFQPDSDNTGKPAIHFTGRHQKYDYSRGYKGYIFSAEDKKTLEEKNYMGHTAMLKYNNGNVKESLITRDKETNLLYSTPNEKLYIPSTYMGYTLTPQDQETLKQGGGINVSGLISPRTQSEFNGEIYIDARTRNLACSMEPQNAYEITKIRNVELSQNDLKKFRNHEVIRVNDIISQNGDPYDRFARINPITKGIELTSYNPLSPEDNREIIIPKVVGGVVVNTPEDQQALVNGQPIYLYDYRKADGSTTNLWFKVDLNSGEHMYSNTQDGFEQRERRWNIPPEMGGIKINTTMRAGLQEGQVYPVTFQGPQGPSDGYLWYDMRANHTQATNYDPRQQSSFQQNQQQAAVQDTNRGVQNTTQPVQPVQQPAQQTPAPPVQQGPPPAIPPEEITQKVTPPTTPGQSMGGLGAAKEPPKQNSTIAKTTPEGKEEKPKAKRGRAASNKNAADQKKSKAPKM